MPDEILDLSALTPVRAQALLRTDANPDGTIYDMAAAADFGATALRQLGRLWEEHETLFNLDAPEPAQERRRDKLLNDFAGKLLPGAPSDEVAALPSHTKRTLAVRFLVDSGLDAMQMMGPRVAKAFSSGRSSPDSNGSTEETPQDG